MEKVTVKAKVAHTAVGNGWKIEGEKYSVGRRYAGILVRLGKVEIVGESAHGHGSLTKPKPEQAGSNEDEGSGPVDAQPDVDEAERLFAEAKAEYTALFGKEPHHRMKYSGIMDAIAAHVKE